MVLELLGADRADINYHRAWLSDQLSHDGIAVKLYRDALRLDAYGGPGGLQPDERLGAHLGLALVHIRMGDRDYAVDVLVAAERRYPDSDQVQALKTLCREDS